MTGIDLSQAFDALNDFDAPIEEELERYYDSSYDVDCSPISDEQYSKELEPRGLFDNYYDEDEDFDPYFDNFEAFLDDIRDEQFVVQDQFSSKDRPHSTRFTTYATFRNPWEEGQPLHVARRVGRRHPQTRHELRREGVIKGRRNEGRKPVRKHRDRRPELRAELEKLNRMTELGRIDPIELAQLNLDENGEFDADLEAERDYDERFPLPKPQPKPPEVWLHI